MHINILAIDHKNHRYPTVGDWWWDTHNTLQIRVSKMSDPRYEQLVALHEVVEALLCDEHEVDEDSVTEFDQQYERDRLAGDKSEPGDSKRAPYYEEHQVAMAVERLMAVQLGVDWSAYEKEVNELA